MTSTRPAALAAALAVLGAGCAGRPIPPNPADPIAFAGEPWTSPIGRDHRLVGYALATRDGRWVDAAEIEAAAAKADWLLLGETHDNADHHRLQARLLRAAVRDGRRPPLAFEMLDAGQADGLAKALAAPPVTPEAIAEATGWAKSGWPDFALYRPIFEVGLGAGLEVVAVNLPRTVAREAVRKGNAALPDDVRAAMERAGEPSPADLASWAKEMEENHCQEVASELLPGMVRAQRARDAQMALRLAAAGAGGKGAVLVTGDGHARADRGVPAWLARLAVPGTVLSIGLVEVDPELRWPRQYLEPYATDRFPFDYVVFTPRAEREEPCEELRRRNREAAARAAAPKPDAPSAASPSAGQPTAPAKGTP
jgi:uncharacterized iron-regulated protein